MKYLYKKIAQLDFAMFASAKDSSIITTAKKYVLTAEIYCMKEMTRYDEYQ